MISESKRPNAGYVYLAKRSAEILLPRSTVTCSGRYKLIVRDAYGTEKRSTPWFDNIILDSGLNRLGTGAIISGAAIGTGTSTPLATQNTLDTQSLWITSVGTGGGVSALGSSPYYNTRTVVYRSPLGSLNGNYTEVGVGWASGAMFSRALILDGGGTPTTISVSSAEQLDIVYQLRVYPPLVDTGPTGVTISGVTYNVVGRARGVNDTTYYWAVQTGFTPSLGTGGGFSVAFEASSNLGSITGSPTGNGSFPQTSSTDSYSSGSYTKTGTMSFGLTECNLTGGIGCTSAFWGLGCFQYEFDNPIPKNATKTLALNYSITWARRP